MIRSRHLFTSNAVVKTGPVNSTCTQHKKTALPSDIRGAAKSSSTSGPTTKREAGVKAGPLTSDGLSGRTTSGGTFFGAP